MPGIAALRIFIDGNLYLASQRDLYTPQARKKKNSFVHSLHDQRSQKARIEFFAEVAVVSRMYPFPPPAPY